MDPTAVQLLGIPGFVVLWIIALLSFTLFGRRVFAFVRLFMKARRENRFNNIGKRVVNLVSYVLGQRRLLNEPLIGAAHSVIFWGFIFFALSFGWNLLRGLFPFLPIPYSDDIGVIASLLEIFAVLVLIGIVVALIRRIFFPPPHLQQTRDAFLILGLISILMLSYLVGQRYKIAGEESSAAIFISMWWLHMIVVLGFLAYLPYSKHMHLLASPFNVFFGDPQAAANIGLSRSEEEAVTGASRWNEFTWKELLNCISCAECGRCDRVCPALTAGYSLSPRLIIHHLKDHLLGAMAVSRKNDAPAVEKTQPLIGAEISESDLWACTTCASCMEQCPVFNEHLQLIVQMRRHLVSNGTVDGTIQDMLMKMSRYGNSFGQSERARAKWTQDIGFTIKDARKEPVQYLWFVGDYASYDPRIQDITRLTAKIFQSAKLDFGILYDGERNSGNDVRRIGEEGLYQLLGEKNRAVLGKASFEAIVTTDPHSYNTLKNEYRMNGHGARVVHYTELFYELLRKGDLAVRKNLSDRITYHDPCYLGRYNGVYEPPRKLLKALGLRLEEMPRNRSRGFCCGAGGGRIWMEESPGIKERPSENRIHEALSLHGVNALAVACPKDIVMFRDAVKTTGNEQRLMIKDVAEFVGEALEIQKGV